MISIAKPLIGEEEKAAVLEVLDSGVLAQGPRVKAFEDAFAEMCGVKHAIATTSGTTALHTAMLVHEIGDGDEVITTSFTFIASANSILYVGARPVFVDINICKCHLQEKRHCGRGETCPTISRVKSLITERLKLFDPMFGGSARSYRLYNCLTNPVASTSCTKLGSTNRRGFAAAAFGSRGAMSSSRVFTPSGVGSRLSG